jgi:hypothetical protein
MGPLTEDECNNCSISPIENEDLMYVVAQNTKDWPEPVDVLAIVIGVIGVIVGIILIGLVINHVCFACF